MLDEIDGPILPRVIIFGARGMLGSYVSRYLRSTEQYHSIIELTRDDYDIANGNRVELFGILHKYRARGRGTVIINCAGIIPQSGEKDTAKYIAVNAHFPVMLDEYAGLFGIKLIHITTDCIFHGRDGKGGYVECDSIEKGSGDGDKNPYLETNDYGRSKRECEEAMVNGMIIRTSIIGEELKTRRSLIEYIKSQRGGKIRGYANHYWNGVTTLQLAKIIHTVIEKKLYLEWKGGVRHFFSPRVYSKYEICKMVNDVYNLGIDVEEYEAEGGVINKSLSTEYTEWYQTHFVSSIPSLEEQIQELYTYGNNSLRASPHL